MRARRLAKYRTFSKQLNTQSCLLMLSIPELGEESLSHVFACVCLLGFFFFLIKETAVNLLV